MLYPTITSAGYVTEVHHVNGKGEDAGVVYSEMQGRENGSGDLMALRSVPGSFRDHRRGAHGSNACKRAEHSGRCILKVVGTGARRAA